MSELVVPERNGVSHSEVEIPGSQAHSVYQDIFAIYQYIEPENNDDLFQNAKTPEPEKEEPTENMQTAQFHNDTNPDPVEVPVINMSVFRDKQHSLKNNELVGDSGGEANISTLQDSDTHRHEKKLNHHSVFKSTPQPVIKEEGEKSLIAPSNGKTEDKKLNDDTILDIGEELPNFHPASLLVVPQTKPNSAQTNQDSKFVAPISNNEVNENREEEEEVEDDEAESIKPEEKDQVVVQARDVSKRRKKSSWKGLTEIESTDNKKKKKKWDLFKAKFMFLKLPAYLVALPIIITLISYNYDDSNITASLNFGFLGFYLGAAHLAFLYQMIDLPILNRIRELEGKVKGLIKKTEYLNVTPKRMISSLITSTLIQIACGQVIRSLSLSYTPIAIILSCIINISLNLVVWLIMLVFRGSVSEEQNKTMKVQTVDKEFRFIGGIRDKFEKEMEDTQVKLKKIQMFMDSPDAFGNKLDGKDVNHLLTLKKIYKDETDRRNLIANKYDFRNEAKKISGKSLKTSIFLGLYLLYVVTLVEMVKSMAQPYNNGAVVVIIAIFFQVFALIFGVLDFERKFDDPSLNDLKTLSIVTTAGIYRYIWFAVPDNGKIGAVLAWKIISKLVFNIGGLHVCEKIARKVLEKKDFYGPESFVNHEAAEEKYYLKHLIYLFQKIGIVQTSDIYFSVASLFSFFTLQYWLDKFTSKLQLPDPGFWIGMTFFDIAVDIILSIAAYKVTNILISRTKYMKNTDLKQEFVETHRQKKWLLLVFQTFTLFLLLLMYVNY